LKRSNRLVLLVGIFLAVVAFVLIAIMLGGGGGGGGGGEPATPTTTNIVIAARDISTGATITLADLTTKEVPIAEKPGTAISEPAVAVGQVARQDLAKDALVTAELWTGANSGNIRNIEVPAGKVAMAVRVDQVSGVGTVIKQGDYVDAVVAFNIQPVSIDEDTGASTPLGEPGTSVKALLQGMQVLGTLLPPPPAPAPDATPPPAGSTSLTDQQQIVVLAVDLQQAEVLNYAQVKGVVAPNGITLVLRSIADFQDADGQPSIPPNTVTTGMILSILIEQYGVLVPGFEGQTPPSPAP